MERESEKLYSFQPTDHKRESNFLGSEHRKKGKFTIAYRNTKDNVRPNLNEANCSERRKYENSSLKFVTEHAASKTSAECKAKNNAYMKSYRATKFSVEQKAKSHAYMKVYMKNYRASKGSAEKKAENNAYMKRYMKNYRASKGSPEKKTENNVFMKEYIKNYRAS